MLSEPGITEHKKLLYHSEAPVIFTDCCIDIVTRRAVTGHEFAKERGYHVNDCA